ncbi:MAG: MoaD/ThiS family protein [Burkholderiaceae bacterium]
MAYLEFAPALQRHAATAPVKAAAATLESLLTTTFAQQPALRSYVLDEQGCVRKHVAVFLNGRLLHDRKRLDVALADDDRIYIAQALSGG